MMQTDGVIGTGPQNGPAIKAFRLMKGLTQVQLAEILRCDQAYLSRVETEKQSAPDRLQDAIASALGVPVDALLRVARPVVPRVKCGCAVHGRAA